MSENVKIKILEQDNTTPAGNGIDSTDIAFIPGFSILPEAPTTPVLVTSTREFEKLFGAVPRMLTRRDVSTINGGGAAAKDYTTYGFLAGDYDRSYVYAKELLFKGMPVVYCNLLKPGAYSTLETDATGLAILTDDYVEVDEDTIELESDENDNIVLKPKCSITKKSYLLQFGVNLDSKPFTFEYGVFTDFEGVEILGYEFDKETLDAAHNAGCKVRTNSINTQIDVDVPTDSTMTGLKVVVRVKISLTANDGDTIKFTVKQLKSSVLDCIYGASATIKNCFELEGAASVADKSIYSVKYITSGGYPSVVSTSETKGGNTVKTPTSVCATEMLAAARYRGDAVALIDYMFDDTIDVFGTVDTNNAYQQICAALAANTDLEFGAAMYPWAEYNCGSTLNFANSPVISMPPSFAYLTCVAKAIKSSPNWLAMAGVTRGLVPGIQKLLVPNGAISNRIAEEMQPKFGVDNHRMSINTITNVRPYGLTLWGNRTLKAVDNEGTVALNFLNTRNMLSDIKKLLYTTAKSCMFEQNSTDLWLKFKNGIEPLLRRLKAGNGISDYQIIKGTTKYNGDPLTKGELAAVIKIYPMYAVEYFELAVELNDEDVTVS